MPELNGDVILVINKLKQLKMSILHLIFTFGGNILENYLVIVTDIRFIIDLNCPKVVFVVKTDSKNSLANDYTILY